MVDRQNLDGRIMTYLTKKKSLFLGEYRTKSDVVSAEMQMISNSLKFIILNHIQHVQINLHFESY